MPAIPRLLFALLILMSASVIGIFMVGETPAETGFSHPDFPAGTILQAPGGKERHAPVLWAASAYGLLVALFAVSVMPLGLRPGKAARQASRILLALGVAYAASLAVVIFLYWRSIHGEPGPYVLGFPLPTAAMIYLFGVITPTWSVILYVVMFSQWVIHPEDIERFDAIVAARRAREASE